MSAVKIAIEAIFGKKGRSFLTMLGIIIGVGAVLILVAVVSGYNADITAYYEKLGVNKVTVSITYYDRTNTTDVSDKLFEFAADDLKEYVQGITPDASITGTMRYMGNTNSSAVVYFGNEQWSYCNNYTLNKGRDILTLDIDNRERVCVIGSYVAESLFGYIDPLGKQITINGSPFVVVGIYYAKDGTAEESMDDIIVIPYSHNRSLLGAANVTDFTVKANNSENMTTVINALDSFLSEELNSNTMSYKLKNGNDAMDSSNEETTSMTLVLAGIASIALLVGGIGIMNIMLVTVTERTREIGIKKAIGAKRRFIIAQFLTESAILSCLGGLIGIAIGYGGSLLIGKMLYDLILYPNPLVALGAAMFSIIIGVCFGLYPAVKASGLQPVDALRTD